MMPFTGLAIVVVTTVIILFSLYRVFFQIRDGWPYLALRWRVTGVTFLICVCASLVYIWVNTIILLAKG